MKKLSIIIAVVVIPIVIFGILILQSPKLDKYKEPFPFELWTFEYDGSIESFPTELLGQKICDITYRCEVPISINIGFMENNLDPSQKSTLESWYDREITHNTVLMDVEGSWNDDKRLEIKSLIEEISGVSDVQFGRAIMP